MNRSPPTPLESQINCEGRAARLQWRLLDPHHARVVKDVLKERSQAGMTVFLSTHQLSVAEELAHRVGIIHRGKLVAVGSPAELRRLSGERQLEDAFLALTQEAMTGAG